MPEDNRSELEKFLGNITPEAPQFEEPVAPKEEEVVEEEKPEDGEPTKLNRQQRRQIENSSIRQQLQEEREARIAAEARAKAIAELKSAGDVDSGLHSVLFGSAPETPETKLVTQNLQRILEQTKTSAVEEAYSRVKSEQDQTLAQEQRDEEFVNERLLDVEEAAGIDLTSNSVAARKARSEFLDVVEKLSPKDEDGNIVEYADFGAAYDMYVATKKPTASVRRNEIANRSIAKSGEPNVVQKEQEEVDTTRDWLRRIGLKV